MLGEARQEPGKVGCGALGCYDQGADGCLWAEQHCEALDTEGHGSSHLYGNDCLVAPV